MIRRLVSSLLDRQQWPTFLIELAIVVIGVFLGIQVSNWNDARLEAAAEVRTLEQLASEFRVLEAELREDLISYTRAQDGTAMLLTTLRSGTRPADDGDLRDALFYANHYVELPAISRTFAELLASGNLGKLSSRELRTSLINYSNYYDRQQRIHSVAFGIVLGPDSNYLTAVQWAADSTQWGDPETAILGYDWEGLLNSKAELQSWLIMQESGTRNVAMMHETALEVLHLLEPDQTVP